MFEQSSRIRLAFIATLIGLCLATGVDEVAAAQSQEAEFAGLLREGCDRGIGLSCVSLGYLYLEGRGVEQDAVEAGLACDVGIAEGCEQLSPFAAAQSHSEACDAGDMVRCLDLVVLYDAGRGVEQDYATASRLLRRACDGDDTAACHHLGVHYVRGLGVSQDDIEGVDLIQAACDEGLRSSCDYLAQLRVMSDPLTSVFFRGVARLLGVPFRDCFLCPRMVIIPQGEARIGSQTGDGGSEPNEYPSRIVSFPKRLAVGRYEVTWNEWDLCVREGGCDGSGPEDNGGDAGWGRESRPVINVNRYEAEAYARWLSSHTGERYRLLTEAEWEYAARGYSNENYSWGRGFSSCDTEVDRGANGGFGCEGNQTYPVGSFRPNIFGLYDVHGNVLEWVADCYHDDYQGAPGNSTAWTGNCDRVPFLCDDCGVLKGGGWDSPPTQMRIPSRLAAPAEAYSVTYGFRVARELD